MRRLKTAMAVYFLFVRFSVLYFLYFWCFQCGMSKHVKSWSSIENQYLDGSK